MPIKDVRVSLEKALDEILSEENIIREAQNHRYKRSSFLNRLKLWLFEKSY
jgi:hypothetical protein